MDKFEARRQLGLPETGYIYIGWVGYFFPWSGVETLLEAAKKILAEFPNARFIIVGHGVWGTHLSDFAQSLGLKVHLMKPLNNAPSHLPSIPLPDPATWQVCFTGEVANELVPVFINSWDIATAPYPGGRNEKSGGSSMKIREYFGCGVPVVTTDVAGIGTRWLIGEVETEIGRNGETESKVTIGERGVLTVPDDADAFAEGLLTLIRDASLREQMGKNAREFAETHCSWDEVARQTVKAFEGAIRKA
jgi:glycosyltransferase involved in cell wall biosynthesis